MHWQSTHLLLYAHVLLPSCPCLPYLPTESIIYCFWRLLDLIKTFWWRCFWYFVVDTYSLQHRWTTHRHAEIIINRKSMALAACTLEGKSQIRVLNQITEWTVHYLKFILNIYSPSDPFSVQYQRHVMIMDIFDGRTQNSRTAQEQIIMQDS